MVKEVFYSSDGKARCEDGKLRTVYVKRYRYDGSYAADTWFSVPAYVKASGTTVRGYLTMDDDGPEFRAYTYCKNHALVGG